MAVIDRYRAAMQAERQKTADAALLARQWHAKAQEYLAERDEARRLEAKAQLATQELRVQLAELEDAMGGNTSQPDVPPPVVVETPLPVDVAEPSFAERVHVANLDQAKALVRDRFSGVTDVSKHKKVVGDLKVAHGEWPAEGIRGERRAIRWQVAYSHNWGDRGQYPMQRAPALIECSMAEPLADGEKSAKFFARWYDCDYSLVDKCLCVGEFLHGRPKPLEHFVYQSVKGDSAMSECYVEGIGGHADYRVHRPFPRDQYEADNAAYSRSPAATVSQVGVVDVDQDASRGSFALTYFDAGSSQHPGVVSLRDVHVVNGWDFTRSTGTNDFRPLTPADEQEPYRVRSCGAFVIHNYYNLDKGQRRPVSLVSISDSSFRAVQSRHPLGAIRSASLVELRNSCFRTDNHRNPYVDIGTSPDNKQKYGHQDVGRVVVKGCKSIDCKLRVWKGDTPFIFDLNEDHDIIVADL